MSHSFRPLRKLKILKWTALLVVLLIVVILCNMLITSRLYRAGRRVSLLRKTTSPGLNKKLPKLPTERGKSPAHSLKGRQLRTGLQNSSQSHLRVSVKPQVSTPKQSAANGEKTEKLPMVTERRHEVLSNQTLVTAVGSSLLEPGSENEAVARRLMSVRRLPIVNPHNFDYRINPAHLCSNKTVEVVLCVVSAVPNFQARHHFRYSIKGGYAGIWNDVNRAVLVFFLGTPNSTNASRIQETVEKESALHGDVVQATYVDSYKNLSIKTVSILKWVSSYCSGAKFAVKTDDDCDVNIPLMMTELRKAQAKEPLFMLGKVSRKLAPLRNSKSKWFIPYSMYKEEKYPTFLYGGSQGYPISVAGLLYEAALRIPIFWLEDVYVSGLCASLVNIPRYDKVAFYFSHFPPPEETEY